MSWISVHNGNDHRLKKAKEQLERAKLSKQDKEITQKNIYKYTIDCLNELNVETGKLTFENVRRNTPITAFDYLQIKEDFELNDVRDILWMKFTENGYLGVVAVSNDINFCIPNFKSEYDYKVKCGKWMYNTSGIIIHYLKEKWDESFVFLFPLKYREKTETIDRRKRHKIEKEVGDYLIEKDIPILDFYSHRIG